MVCLQHGASTGEGGGETGEIEREGGSVCACARVRLWCVVCVCVCVCMYVCPCVEERGGSKTK